MAPEFSLPPLLHHLQQRSIARRTTVACLSASADRPSTVGWRLVRGIPAAGPSDPVPVQSWQSRRPPIQSVDGPRIFSSCAIGCTSPFHPVTALPYPTPTAQEPSCGFVAPLPFIVPRLLFYAFAFYCLRPRDLAALFFSSPPLLPLPDHLEFPRDSLNLLILPLSNSRESLCMDTFWP